MSAVIEAAGLAPSSAPRIRAVGYWDTVGAMGLPDGTIEPFDEEKTQYLDQFCNVKYVFHATSLDDTRAYDFTPLLASGPRTREPCEDDPRAYADVDEVWFSGAHADVGGAYSNELALEGHLPGNSLNWMIARVRAIDPDLLPPGAGQYANPYDMIHDSQKGLAVWRVRRRAFRDVMGWAQESGYNARRPKIHISVAQRLEKLFEIDRAFSTQCRAPRQPPALLCSDDLAQEREGAESPAAFLTGLLDRKNCVTRVHEPDPVTGATRDGYTLVGSPVSDGTRPEVHLACVTLAFDNVFQRDAYVTARGGVSGRSSDAAAANGDGALKAVPGRP